VTDHYPHVRSGRVSYLIAIANGIAVLLAVCPMIKADIDTPVEQAEKLYKANRPQEARRILLRTFRNVSAYQIELADNKQATPRGMAGAIGNIVSWSTRALDWEAKAAGVGDATDSKLVILLAGRNAADRMWVAMRDTDMPGKQKKVLFDKATYSLSSLVRHELTILDAAKRTEAAGRLRKRYSSILELPKPQLKPGTPEFIRESRAPAGPLQKIDACYRMRMPEAGRVRLIQLFTAMRDGAVANAKKRPAKVEVALIPKRMAEYVFRVMSWEEGLTAENTRDQYLPRAALPVLRRSLQLTKEAYDAVSSVRQVNEPWRQSAAQSAEWVQRLRGFEKRAAAQVLRRGSTLPASGPVPPIAGVDWRKGHMITGEQLQICCLVNAFYEAMAKEDVKALNGILATGRDYATGRAIVDYIAKARAGGEFERIEGYRVVPQTQYRIVRDADGLRVLVTGLQSRIVVKGSVRSGTKSGAFVVIQTKGGLRLGFPKETLQKPIPKSSTTRPSEKAS